MKRADVVDAVREPADHRMALEVNRRGRTPGSVYDGFVRACRPTQDIGLSMRLFLWDLTTNQRRPAPPRS